MPSFPRSICIISTGLLLACGAQERPAEDPAVNGLQTVADHGQVKLIDASRQASVRAEAVASRSQESQKENEGTSVADGNRETSPQPALAAPPGKESRAEWMQRTVVRFFYTPFDRLFRHIIFTVPFWAALTLTLLLERLIPAEKNRKLFSVSFRQDLVWFLYEPLLHAFVTGTYVGLLVKLHSVYFTSLTFFGLTQAPEWVRVGLGILLVDLGYWIQHFINHKVPFLWKLHALHHSQRELNFFTDFRYHPLEYIVRHTFVTVPFIFLRIDPPVIVAIAILKDWYSRFYHGNIRTNLGLFRYMLVTPQSHRIHHSIEARHRDLNFGALFSFWDFLFRTQYKGYEEYPATGVEGDKFSADEKGDIKTLFLSPWTQMWRRFWRR